MNTVVLELDAYDYEVINEAVTLRHSFPGGLPDERDGNGEMSNQMGLTLAEICRGWLAYHDGLKAMHASNNPIACALNQLLKDWPEALAGILKPTEITTPDKTRMSTLGLLNFVLAASGLPKIGAVYEGVGDEMKLVGFQKYVFNDANNRDN